MLVASFTNNANVSICAPKSNYGFIKWYYVMPRTREIRFELIQGVTEASNSNSNEYSYPIALGGKTALEREFNKTMYETNLQMVINAFSTKNYLAVQTDNCLSPSPLPVVTYIIVGNIVP